MIHTLVRLGAACVPFLTEVRPTSCFSPLTSEVHHVMLLPLLTSPKADFEPLQLDSKDFAVSHWFVS